MPESVSYMESNNMNSSDDDNNFISTNIYKDQRVKKGTAVSPPRVASSSRSRTPTHNPNIQYQLHSPTSARKVTSPTRLPRTNASPAPPRSTMRSPSPISKSKNTVNSTELDACIQSLAVAGVIEALGLVGSDASELFSPTGSIVLQTLGNKLNAVFKYLKENVVSYSHGETFGGQGMDSTISIKLLKSSIMKLGVVDESHFKSRDVDILFASYGGMKRATVFELSHCFTSCGKKRFTDVPIMEFIVRMSGLVDNLLVRLKEDTVGCSNVNPLDDISDLTESEFSDVLKLLEREKKALFTIYQSYLQLVHEEIYKWDSKNPNNDSAADFRSPLRKKMTSIIMNNNPIISSGRGYEMGLSFTLTLQFAKDFQISPELINRAQLAEIFNSIFDGEDVSNDRETTSGVLCNVDNQELRLSFYQVIY